MGKYFEEYNIGEIHNSWGRTITETDVVNFAGISGDFFRLHTDEEWSKKESLFKTRIAHGALTFSVMTGHLTKIEDFSTVQALYGVDKIRWIRPVFFGDTITSKFTVSGKEEHAAGGILTVNVEVHNQRSELVMACVLKLLTPKKPR